MQKLITIKKDESILVSSQVESFLKPDYVYLPLLNEDHILVRLKDKIKIGDALEQASSYLAPVSGVVRGLKKMTSLKNVSYFFEIENDFEERRKEEAKIKCKISKKEFLSLFPNLAHKKNVVLNAIDDEVYVSTENFYLFLHYEEFLELLDKMYQLFSLENIYVCLRASSSENITQLMSDLGMYPHILLKMVPDTYLLGQSSFLLSYLGLHEEDTEVILASKLNDAYSFLVRGRTKSDQLITISGNAVKKPMVIQVKVGSLLQDIVNELVCITSDDVLYFANGLMRGKEICLDSFVVTEELNSLLIMKRQEKEKAGKCIRCGMCHDICPVHLHPLLFSNPTYWEQAENKCIKCGLCSYICPVHIQFLLDRKEEHHE